MQIKKNVWNNKDAIRALKNDGVVVMPTDTIYGIVGKAENESVVNRIYSIRKRDPKKPCIILIGDIGELNKFSVSLNEEQKKELEKYWLASSGVEGSVPTSIILDCPDEKFLYLHRGAKSLAFRLPAPEGLRDLLLKVGPLIAPSANLETFPPNDNVHDAKKYFGDSVDLYVDGGVLAGKASKIIKLHKDGTIAVIRT